MGGSSCFITGACLFINKWRALLKKVVMFFLFSLDNSSLFNILDLIDKSKPSENSKNLKVLDFGSGTGHIAKLFTKRFGVSPDCLEIDKQLRLISQNKGLSCYSDFEDLPFLYDFVYSSNVLEHIEDDVDALKSLANVMHSGSVLGVYVPAFNFLYSSLDAKVGHFRRYSKKELMNKIQLSGFEITKIQFVDSIGFFASIAIKILGFKDHMSIGSDKSLKFYDKFIFPFSKICDVLGFKYFLGKNLYCTAVKK